MLKSRFLTVIVLFGFVALFSISCGDDNPVASEEESIVGTWVLTKMTATFSGVTLTIPADEMSITVTIKSDNTYQATIIEEGITTPETGTWSISGNTVTLTDSDGEITTATFTIEGNKLTISFTETEEGVVLTIVQEFVRQ